MATRNLSERVLGVLGRGDWSTTSQVAAALGVSASTARKHLIDLVVRGMVERREDAWDGRGYSWRLLEEPIGTAPPTSLLLCSACAVMTHKVFFRYRKALTPEALERWEEANDHLGEDESLIPPCAKCGRPIV